MAERDQQSVVYVLPDKMGGMMNIVSELLAHRCVDDFSYHAVLTHNHLHEDARFAGRLAAESQTVVEYSSPTENLHAVMRRLAGAIPPGGGVYVAGDLVDLATASVHDFGRAVVFMLHGDTDYYYDLAVKHDPVVHAFVTYSRRMFDVLRSRLPHRWDSIFHLPYGVSIPSTRRGASAGSLRVVFAGRFEHGQKGVFDLPAIDRVLRERGVHVRWTIAGAGPDEDEFRRRWSFNPHVVWRGCLSKTELVAEYSHQDVFVLPTRFEGFPVALLEAMASGLVPVVSDIPSGVPEVVEREVSGRTPPAGDVPGFADALQQLDYDRARLEAMSQAAAAVVAARFDIRERVSAYQTLYRRWRDFYRPLAGPEHLQYGSRLDKPWIPNPIVRAVRSALKAG
jgi:glycosyltransferase involved in cell wall biosynthesis